MSQSNFMRRYILKCGPKGGKGFEIGHIKSASEDALHVSFSVEKSSVESPNSAKVQIWNLSDANLKILDKKDCILELRAGYDDNMALIMVGNVTASTTTLENADRMTEIEVTDGRVALRDTRISVSLNGKVNSKDVYNKVANEMGLPISFAKDVTFKKIPNGFTFAGRAKDAIKKIAKLNNHSWSIQNGAIQVTRHGRAMNTKGFLLSSETGLIGIPKKISISQSGSKKSQTGYEVEYLLNGAIGVNDIVNLKSSKANGYFLVYKVTLDGDNLEGDWICTAQLIKVAAQSKLDKK